MVTARRQILKCIKCGAEKVMKKIGDEGKDHQGLPIQIVHTSPKCWVVKKPNKVATKTFPVNSLPKPTPTRGL